MDDGRSGRWVPRHPGRRPGPGSLGGADRLVLGAAVLQRHAGRDGGGAARPGPGRAAGHRRRRPRRLPPHRVGGRHLRGQGLHRQRAGDVPGSVRHRRVLHRAVRAVSSTTVGSPRRTSRRGHCGSSLGTYYVSPRRHPDFAWAFASRFMFILAYAFLVTYQAYYLLDHLGSAEDEVPQQIFVGTLTQAVCRRGRFPGRRSALGPHRPPQALRGGRLRSCTAWRCS